MHELIAAATLFRSRYVRNANTLKRTGVLKTEIRTKNATRTATIAANSFVRIRLILNFDNLLFNLISYSVNSFEVSFAPGAELCSQAGNVGVNGSGVADKINAPNIIEKLFS